VFNRSLAREQTSIASPHSTRSPELRMTTTTTNGEHWLCDSLFFS
jgi:hypothetical protein